MELRVLNHIIILHFNRISCFLSMVKKIVVTLINTAWRCFDSKKDKGRILIGKRQLLSSQKLYKSCDFHLAVGHHYCDELRTFDKEDCEPILKAKYDVYCCGHTHKGKPYSIGDDVGNIVVSCISGQMPDNQNIDSQKYANSFLVIDCDIDERIYSIY